MFTFLKFLLYRSLRYRVQRMTKRNKLRCLEKIQAKSREMIKCKLIMKTKIENSTSAFIRHWSIEIHKLVPKSPSKAIAVLKHVWEQTYKSPQKKILMDKME